MLAACPLTSYNDLACLPAIVARTKAGRGRNGGVSELCVYFSAFTAQRVPYLLMTVLGFV